MALHRITGRECLNVSSDSPFVRNRKVPLLGTSPWSQRRFLNKSQCSTPERFGTPSYPSGLDRLRNGREYGCERANASFSHLPRPKLKTFVKQPKGNDLHSFSFSPSYSKGSFNVSEGLSSNKDTTMTKGHWQLRSFVVGKPHGEIHPRSILNPNKLVISVDSTGTILTVNDVMTYILGYAEDEICNMKLDDFIANPKVLQRIKTALLSSKDATSAQESYPVKLEDPAEIFAPLNPESDVVEGEGLVLFSGKVISLRTKEENEIPVSIWMKRLHLREDEEPKWLAVMEPVHIITSNVIIDAKGLILRHDKTFLDLFHQQHTNQLENRNILDYIPSMKLPRDCNSNEQDIYHQDCTGRISDETVFPLGLALNTLTSKNSLISDSDQLYEIKIQVCMNISGLVVLDETGIILDYNHNFTRHLFGYGSKELLGKCITDMIPCFEKLLIAPPTDMDLHTVPKDEREEETIDLGTKSHQHYANSTTLPYIDDSLKENIFDAEDAKNRKPSFAHLSRINSEGSTVSPNKAFLASDSQFITSISSYLATSKSGSQRNTSDNQNTQSFDANSTENKDDREINSTTAQVSSPTHQPSHAMKDITNSIKLFSITDQIGSEDASELAMSHSMITSTPALLKYRSPPADIPASMAEGSYCGLGKHKNGSNIVVTYQIKQVVFNNTVQYCVWILWEPESDDATRLDVTSSFSVSSSQAWIKTPKDTSCRNLLDDLIEEKSRGSDSESSVASSTSSSPEDTDTEGSSEGEYSLHHSRAAEEDKVKVKVIKPNEPIKDQSLSLIEEEEEILVAGQYGKQYSILRQIGKGAFGCVKMSYRNKDGLMVVTKFIRKNKVYRDSWEEDFETGRKIPLEISFLRSLDHPNIVSAIEYFENDDYFQLVMEKFGAGMDLFDFIDRNPILDEPLASYIFRQIISAIVYLRTKGIIHRDIKDENIIINQHFHIKLIDFGSATYMKDGQTFSQFAGTVEYCSPEVIKGYKYTGPELEVWSLGITLYTLIYGENPFYDVDEILSSSLRLPITYSEDLENLLGRMLQKDPKERMLLEDVALHPWTNQQIQILSYVFEDVVKCSDEELNPKNYIWDYSTSDISLSTTSSSFLFSGKSFSFEPPQQAKSPSEDDSIHQRSMTSLGSSPGKRADDSLSKNIDEQCVCLDDSVANIGDYEDSSSPSLSRTSTTQSVASLRSTVTIDSSLLTFSSASCAGGKSVGPSHSPEFDTDLPTDDSRSSSRLSSSFSDISESNYSSSETFSSGSGCSLDPNTVSLGCSSEEETLATTPPRPSSFNAHSETQEHPTTPSETASLGKPSRNPFEELETTSIYWNELSCLSSTLQGIPADQKKFSPRFPSANDGCSNILKSLNSNLCVFEESANQCEGTDFPMDDACCNIARHGTPIQSNPYFDNDGSKAGTVEGSVCNYFDAQISNLFEMQSSSAFRQSVSCSMLHAKDQCCCHFGEIESESDRKSPSMLFDLDFNRLSSSSSDLNCNEKGHSFSPQEKPHDLNS